MAIKFSNFVPLKTLAISPQNICAVTILGANLMAGCGSDPSGGTDTVWGLEPLHALARVIPPLLLSDPLLALTQKRQGENLRQVTGVLNLTAQSAQHAQLQGLSWSLSAAPFRTGLNQARLMFRQRPVLGAQVVFEGDPESPAFISGFVPAFTGDGVHEGTDSEQGILRAQASESAASTLGLHRFRFQFQREAWLTSYGPVPLQLVYEFVVSADPGLPEPYLAEPLRVLVDARTGGVMESLPLAFHLDGKARALYRENRIASAAEGPLELDLPDLKDGTFLTGRRLRILTCNSMLLDYARCTQGLRGYDGIFETAFDSGEYEEANAYASISRAMAWHRSLMNSEMIDKYGDFGLKYPLDVFVRVRRKKGNETTLDVAGYFQRGLGGTESPLINIGTGWEEGQAGSDIRLRYLGKDADVLTHEFGHHVVARSLTETTEQSGSLHEGFADYFTYAMTGNNTLAESVVPLGSGSKFLRHANLTGSIADYIKLDDIHRIGEYWSSLLWNLRGQLGPWKNGFAVFDKIVWDSIDFLPANAGFYQAMAALVKSSEVFALAEGRDKASLRKPIIDSFRAAGFFAEGETLPNGLPPPASVLMRTSADEQDLTRQVKVYPTLSGEVSRPVASARVSSSEYNISQAKGCGTLGKSASESRGSFARPGLYGWVFTILLALPLALPLAWTLALMLAQLCKRYLCLLRTKKENQDVWISTINGAKIEPGSHL